jgi:DNA-binding beta-propeller fold protein YncE
VIDGSTDTNLTPTARPLGSQGPFSINAGTGTLYEVRMSTAARDEVTFYDPAIDQWYTIATGSFQPTAMAVNPVTDTIFVAHYGTGDVRVISGAYDANDDFPATTSIGAWTHPFAVAVNPVTNKAYVLTQDSRGPIGIIDGATRQAVFPLPASGHAVDPRSLAVNPVTNRIYAVFDGEVVVIDGATNAYTYVPIGTSGAGPTSIAVDAGTNRIYVATANGAFVTIDGQTNATSTAPIPSGAVSMAINPITQTAYVFGDSLTRIALSGTGNAVPIATTISTLPGDTSDGNPAFTLTSASTFAPNAPPIVAMYYQLDSTVGAWTAAGPGGSVSFTNLAPGPHTLNAFSADPQLPITSTGPQSSAVLGAIAAYAFTVSGTPRVTPTVGLASSRNPANPGEAITFTASVSGSAGTATGTIAFKDGAVAIAGCGAVALGSGSAACTTSALAGGSHAITARYSGDTAYNAVTSGAIAQTVNASTSPVASVALASSQNPSSAGASITFTATVSGNAAAPTGSVDFLDGSAVIAGCAGIVLSGGAATCSTASLTTGDHGIVARYGGDGTYGAAASNTVAQSVRAAGQATLALSASTIDFGAQSMGTTSLPRELRITNTGSASAVVSGIAISDAQFAGSSDCATLAPSASCTVTVMFTPAASSQAQLDGEVPVQATLTIDSDAASGPASVALAGSAEKSLVVHYYQSILRREPDAGGKAFWMSETQRLAGLGANVNEAWYAMAMAFLSSAEYIAQGRDDAGFVTDLYNTFFNRPPDASGLSFWTQQIASGMPREVVLVSFMFSTEFQQFAQSIFGNTAARAEVDVVGDFYRGLLARLPDNDGFNSWVGGFRDAQCGQGDLYATVEAISGGFAGSPEYTQRNRTDAQFVGDLYNAFLRRGGDAQGVQFWIGQLASKAQTRDQVRRQFIASSEFNGRVTAVANQGCLR